MEFPNNEWMAARSFLRCALVPSALVERQGRSMAYAWRHSTHTFPFIGAPPVGQTEGGCQKSGRARAFSGYADQLIWAANVCTASLIRLVYFSFTNGRLGCHWNAWRLDFGEILRTKLIFLHQSNEKLDRWYFAWWRFLDLTKNGWQMFLYHTVHWCELIKYTHAQWDVPTEWVCQISLC